MIVLTKPNFLGINFDLGIYSTAALDDKLFTLFYKNRPTKPSGLEVSNENIKEYSTQTIIVPTNTWDTEVIFDNINNVRFLTIFAKITNDSYTTSKQPEFLLKIDSKSAPAISVEEFLHLGLRNGLQKIYISNPFICDLEIKIFYAGDDTKRDDRVNNVFYKNDDLKQWTINHNLGIIPTSYLLFDENNQRVTDFTVQSVNKNTITLSFSGIFKGKFIINRTYTHTQTDLSVVWTIQHNLDRYVNYLCFSSGGMKLTPTQYEYIDSNTIKLTFGSAATGTALIY